MIPLFVLAALAGLMQAARSFAPGALAAGGTELAFGFLLLTAFFTARVVSRLGLPKLTGYIGAGILVGPSVLGLVDKAMTGQLKLVGGTATAILALSAGAELNLRAIKPLMRTIRRVALFAVLGTMVVLAGTLVILRPTIPFLDALPLQHAAVVAMSIAIALTAQSPAVVMALIGETRADGPLTKTILALVVVADLAVIIAYGVASAAATAVISGNVDLGGAIGGIAWEVFGSFGVGMFIGVLLGLFVQHVAKGAGLFAVMMCLVIAEIGNAVHLDPLIIALTAGLWVENVASVDARKLIDGFDQASLPVYLVFFALAGAKLDLAALVAVLLPVGVIVAIRGSSFYLGSRVATRGPDVDPVVRRLAWIGLLPQAGLALALAELVRRTFPAFGDAAFALVVGVVATNEMIAPVILRVAFLRSGEAGKRAGPATKGH